MVVFFFFFGVLSFGALLALGAFTIPRVRSLVFGLGFLLSFSASVLCYHVFCSLKAVFLVSYRPLMFLGAGATLMFWIEAQWVGWWVVVMTSCVERMGLPCRFLFCIIIVLFMRT